MITLLAPMTTLLLASYFLGRYNLSIDIKNAVLASLCVHDLRRQSAVPEGTSPKLPTGKRGPIRQACRRPRDLALVLIILAVSVTGAAAGSNKSTLNITNQCSYTVWPGILSRAAVSSAAALDTTGFQLAPGESRAMPVPSEWSGLLWGRTLCATDATTGNFTCATGDCGSGMEDCAGGGPAPPATLAEFTLDGTGGKDVYDVSLVNGFNLPMLVAPQGAAPGRNRSCAPTGCAVDLNGACPAELRVKSEAAGGVVACKSACQAFGSSQYCCTGAYGNPGTCKPSAYSQFFKNLCPRAVSYAYDNGAASVFTCDAADTIYAITFCPSATRTSAKSSDSGPNSQPPGNANLPLINVTVPYAGSSQVGAAAGASPPWRIVLLVGVLSLLTAVLGVMAQILGLVTHCFNQNQREAAVADGDQEGAVADGDQEGREIRPPPTDEAVPGGHKVDVDPTVFFSNGPTRSCPCSASSPSSCSSCRRRAQEPPPPSCLHHHWSSASATHTILPPLEPSGRSPSSAPPPLAGARYRPESAASGHRQS